MVIKMTRNKRKYQLHRLVATALILASLLGAFTGITASAKTSYSEKAERVFFYAANADGKAVLLKVVTLDELKALSHGQLTGITTGADTGENYYISTTDNYPTTQYCEVRGFTVPELVDYIKRVTTVRGAENFTFSGDDTIRFMATDSFGNYNRSWTYDELYGVERYYFEGLYDKGIGWKPGWEVAGEDNSKFGIDLETYEKEYRSRDQYYDNKRTVFEGGALTTPILATESFSGRTTSNALVTSTEIGISEYIEDNDGVVSGCLAGVLEDTWSLRLSLPMTESDLMGARRTAFDNFKWIYNLRLDMANAPDVKSLGTVAEPVVNIGVTGGNMTITVTCSTPGATIYYSYDGSPQIPYTGALKLDVNGRNLAADPVTVYITAVKEGWDDAGIITAKYPGLAPAFKMVYSGITATDAVFEAAEGVSSQTWNEWANAMQFVTVKTPSSVGYVRLDTADYKFDNPNKSVTFDGSLFTETGSYSFVFHAAGYADKSVSLTIKKPAIGVSTPSIAKIGMPLTFRFTDADFQNGLTLYVTPPGGDAVMIAASWLDRTKPGRVVLKAAYFDSSGCVIKDAGEYTFGFVNSRYEPNRVNVDVNIGAGTIATLDDVKAEHWYYDAVRFALGAGLFNTASDTSFGAEAPTTRLAMAEALYRLSGSPEVTGESPFSDSSVPSVIWASTAGIVNGMGDGTFAPDVSITREQIATMFHRYAKYIGAELSQKGDLTVFSDRGKISDWALDALEWANGAGLINGMGDGTIAPQGTAIRAQVSQVLLNYAG